MMLKAEVLEWVNSLPAKAFVAVEEGGLALVAIMPDPGKTASQEPDPGAMLEIGGVPIEKYRCETCDKLWYFQETRAGQHGDDKCPACGGAVHEDFEDL